MSGRPLFRLTVKQYQRMEEVGIITTDHRVELIEGFLVNKERLSPPNAVCISRVRDELDSRIPPGWFVRSQADVELFDSQPQPDAAVIIGESDDYARRHPRSEEVALVVEVADKTVEEDRETRGRIYAQGNIPTYWIVNITDRQLEVYTQPRAGANPTYRATQTLAATDSVTVIIGGTVIGPISVADLLPPCVSAP